MKASKKTLAIFIIGAEAVGCTFMLIAIGGGESFWREFLAILGMLSLSFFAVLLKKLTSAYLSATMMFIVFLFFYIHFALDIKSNHEGGASMILIPLIFFGVIFALAGSIIGLYIDHSSIKKE